MKIYSARLFVIICSLMLAHDAVGQKDVLDTTGLIQDVKELITEKAPQISEDRLNVLVIDYIRSEKSKPISVWGPHDPTGAGSNEYLSIRFTLSGTLKKSEVNGMMTETEEVIIFTAQRSRRKELFKIEIIKTTSIKSEKENGFTLYDGGNETVLWEGSVERIGPTTKSSGYVSRPQ